MTADLRRSVSKEHDDDLPPDPEADGPAPPEVVVIASLSLSGSPRVQGEDLEHVHRLATIEAILPPILVHRPTMRVIDGRHRVAAALRRGESVIAARFFDGGEADAFVLSVTTNVRHGLPLSLQDRRAAAARIVTTHEQCSDRVIASITGLSPRTVAEVRIELGRRPDASAVRVGRDGRARPLDSSRGRTLAAELLREKPELSLRQVATRVGLSPETVRDVRRRLSLGQPSYGGGTGGTDEAVLVARLRTRRAARQVLVQRLQSDPEIQHSKEGKALMMLLAHMSQADTFDRLVDGIPAHRSDTVAELAQRYSRIWAEFAEQIERGVRVG